MTKRRLLVLTPWYPPEPIRFLEDLGVALADSGFEVEVLTGFPTYPLGRLYNGFQLRPWLRQRQRGLRVTRVPLLPDHSRNVVRRALSYLSFALAAMALGPLLVSRAHVIFVYGSPYTAALPGRLLSILWRAPMLFFAADVWPESVSDSGMLRNGMALRVVRWYAELVHHWSSIIFVNSEGWQRHLGKHGATSKKVRVLSGWVDPNYFVPVDGSPLPETRDRFTVMYAGNLGETQGLDTFLEASAILATRNPRVRCMIVGDGTAATRLRCRATELQLCNVEFVAHQPEGVMPSWLVRADALLLLVANLPLFCFAVPHKVFAYMSVARPIIAAAHGEAAALIRRWGAGLVCPPGDASLLADAIDRLACMSPSERANMGASGRRAVVDHYSTAAAVQIVRTAVAETLP